MPTRSLERWNRDGENLRTYLTDLGYAVELQFADNEIEQQISQVETMAGKVPAVMIVAAIDGSALGPVLENIAAKDIGIIAYDRLIRDTSAVDYYVTFDNYRVGTLQGRYIVDALDLEHAPGPFNFEPFTGSPDDNNARFYFEGAWDVLTPYIPSWAWIPPGSRSSRGSCCSLRWPSTSPASAAGAYELQPLIFQPPRSINRDVLEHRARCEPKRERGRL